MILHRSVIRRGPANEELTFANTKNYLHCGEFLPFYVSWENGLIKVCKVTDYICSRQTKYEVVGILELRACGFKFQLSLKLVL